MFLLNQYAMMYSIENTIGYVLWLKLLFSRNYRCIFIVLYKDKCYHLKWLKVDIGLIVLNRYLMNKWPRQGTSPAAGFNRKKGETI